MRIVRREEVIEALNHGAEIAKSKEHARTELAALREWVGYNGVQKDHYGRTYPYELIDEIEKAIADWPDPVTIEDLREEQS